MRWKLNVSIKHFAVFCCWLKSKHRFILFFSFNFIYIFIQPFVNGFWEHVSMPKKIFFFVDRTWKSTGNWATMDCVRTAFQFGMCVYIHTCIIWLKFVRTHSQLVSQSILIFTQLTIAAAAATTETETEAIEVQTIKGLIGKSHL